MDNQVITTIDQSAISGIFFMAVLIFIAVFWRVITLQSSGARRLNSSVAIVGAKVYSGGTGPLIVKKCPSCQKESLEQRTIMATGTLYQCSCCGCMFKSE